MKFAHDAAGGLSALLDEIPATYVEETEFEPGGHDGGVDFVIRVRTGGKMHALACEVKDNGQPRSARAAILQLQNSIPRLSEKAAPVFIAPYISDEARTLCQENGVNYYDLHGNCRIVLAGLFIERAIADKPPTERRELKSLFKPKSARVLRLLLREPSRHYKLTEISDLAQVSIGQAHNVKEGLVAREWATVTSDGLSLTKPDMVLDAWREVYEAPRGSAHGFYTILHGQALESAIRQALPKANEEGRAALASYSAAEWLAPYVRNDTRFFYANDLALFALREQLNLSPASKGANVVVTLLEEEGPLFDAVEPAPGMRVTSPVQTYLDLSAAGERGREAAAHLRRETLSWQTR